MDAWLSHQIVNEFYVEDLLCWRYKFTTFVWTTRNKIFKLNKFQIKKYSFYSRAWRKCSNLISRYKTTQKMKFLQCKFFFRNSGKLHTSLHKKRLFSGASTNFKFFFIDSFTCNLFSTLSHRILWFAPLINLYMIPLDTGRKLNVHEMFRNHLLNVVYTFSLLPVSRSDKI